MKEFLQNTLICLVISVMFNIPYNIYTNSVERKKGFEEGLKYGEIIGRFKCLSDWNEIDKPVSQEYQEGVKKLGERLNEKPNH